MEHRHQSEWRTALKVAELAPNTGMVPVKGCALLAVQAEIERLREALQAMVDCSHSMDVRCCARASQLAAAALRAQR